MAVEKFTIPKHNASGDSENRKEGFDLLLNHVLQRVKQLLRQYR
jgi:hypothetical protein